MINSALKYFSDLYSLIKLPIEVLNSEGRIFFVNKAFTGLWGYTLDELNQYSVFEDNYLIKSSIASKIKEVFENKLNVELTGFADSLLNSRDVTPPILKTSINYLEIQSEPFVVLVHYDETELKLTELEIEKARDAHNEADRLKNTFLNVLSHELRTPLNIVLGYSSLIKESLGDKIDPDDKIYLDNLYSGSERLFRTITQMLEFAQIESGNYLLNIEPVELISLVKKCLAEISEEAKKKNIDIKMYFSESSVLVSSDAQCLENTIKNLLENAVKFTNLGFIEVEIDVLKDKEFAICKIRDSGIGISSEYMDHLFQPFSQEDLNIGRTYEGNGLGLALAKRYIEKMGGSILVDSQKGVGSTFSFTIPLLSQNQTIKQNKENKSSVKKILMLDDAGDSFSLINAFLKKVYEIESYSFRDFKFDFLSKDDFQLIFFDVSVNHWKQSLIITKDLKRNDKFKRPILIISSEYNEEKIQEFYDAGANKFLIKPFSKKDLLKAISDIHPEVNQ